MPKAPSARFGAEILASIGLPNPSLTPIQPTSKPNNLPVKILYDGPKLKGDYVLDVVLSKPDRKKETRAIRPLSRSILYLDGFDAETDLALNLTAGTDDLQLEATLRDTNGNLILQTSHPIPVVSEEPRLLRLSNPNIPLVAETGIPDFTNLETIIGKVTLPRKTVLPLGAKLHVQLLENALAGGLSMALVAEDTRDARLNNGELAFVLHRGLWDGQNPEDLSIKAWITDTVGRQIYVMNVPVGYNGPDIEYDIRLVGLKQGKNTKRGRTLPHELMAQTLIQGEAAFDPVIGIPGQARLNIKLKQDRGDYNRNPVLAEQTLILRGMETRIPFSLTTDSTHFDPYAPAPFLSVSLTDSLGRVYYKSGDIRARGGKNSIRLYPQ